MDKTEFAKGMARLAAAYREDLGDATVEVYYDELGGGDPEDFAGAVSNVIRNNVWFPKVAELVSEMELLRSTRRLRLAPGEPLILKCSRCPATFPMSEWGAHDCMSKKAEA